MIDHETKSTALSSPRTRPLWRFARIVLLVIVIPAITAGVIRLSNRVTSEVTGVYEPVTDPTLAKTIAAEGQQTIATVTRVSAIAIRSQDMPNTEVYYQYEAGNAMCFGKYATTYADNTPREGARLTVTFLPSNPHQHIVRGP